MNEELIVNIPPRPRTEEEYLKQQEEVRDRLRALTNVPESALAYVAREDFQALLDCVAKQCERQATELERFQAFIAANWQRYFTSQPSVEQIEEFLKQHHDQQGRYVFEDEMPTAKRQKRKPPFKKPKSRFTS